MAFAVTLTPGWAAMVLAKLGAYWLFPFRSRGIIIDMTVVRINAITVPADSGDELARRFAARAGAVDNQDGFEGFELLKPTDGRTTWLVVTRWRDEDRAPTRKACRRSSATTDVTEARRSRAIRAWPAPPRQA